MIDWVTARVPLRLPRPIHDGQLVKVNRAGEVEKVIHQRQKVRGSFNSNIMVRAPSTGEVEISGNLAKFLQGHNLYGSDCPAALIWATLEHLEAQGVLGCALAEAGAESVNDVARTVLTRVDVTEMIALPDLGAVKAWLRAAYARGSVTHRGRGLMRGDTVIFGDAAGKSFARWQIVLYAKGQEVQAHPLPDVMAEDPEVAAWVAGQLRAEVRLGRLELEERGLRHLAGWMVETGATPPQTGKIARLVWNEKMGKLRFSETDEGTATLDALPRHLAGTFAQWKVGGDLRRRLAKPTFYRHRAEILAAVGVDIAVPPAPSGTAEIVPIRRVLEGKVSGRPSWADRIDAALASRLASTRAPTASRTAATAA